MTRLLEIALALAPFGAYLLWRYLTNSGAANPSRTTLLALLVVLVLFGGGLAWMGLSEREGEGLRYVPARLLNGHIVPGHGA